MNIINVNITITLKIDDRWTKRAPEKKPSQLVGSVGHKVALWQTCSICKSDIRTHKALSSLRPSWEGRGVHLWGLKMASVQHANSNPIHSSSSSMNIRPTCPPSYSGLSAQQATTTTSECCNFYAAAAAAPIADIGANEGELAILIVAKNCEGEQA